MWQFLTFGVQGFVLTMDSGFSVFFWVLGFMGITACILERTLSDVVLAQVQNCLLFVCRWIWTIQIIACSLWHKIYPSWTVNWRRERCFTFPQNGGIM
mgnify:CR=1 FL=1